MLAVTRVDASDVRALSPTLSALLRDGVDGDAGLGFVAPLDMALAAPYWQGVADDIARGSRLLVVAMLDGALVGSAQLDLCGRPNSLHRAEVQKVMVFSHARRRGVGRALMDALEREAHAAGRTTLHLDTFEGDVGESLYRAAGWTRAGAIPEFAQRANGALGATVIYYKLLGR